MILFGQKAMTEIKEFNITVPWGHIAVKTFGSPTNFPVLCVHGLLDNAGTFSRLIAQLPDEYYYVTIDLPGHGLSSHLPHGITLNYYDYILSLRLVVENFKWKHFHYIGHSLGAQFGALYSVVYPNQIRKLVLVEGFAAITPNEEIISVIRRAHESTVKFEKEKERLYTRDEIMHSLRFKRSVCLNTDAAEAIFKRSISEINGMFKFNRDIRLKVPVVPILNLEQIATIFSKIHVEKILFFLSSSTIESLHGKGMLLLKESLENIDVADVKIVEGNHDIHNNHPERLAIHISELFTETNIFSKL